MSPPSPPRAASRWLRAALGDDPAAPAILGDLHEEFVERARRRGRRHARAWYACEAALLSIGRLVHHTIRSFTGDRSMSDPHGARAFARDAVYALRALRRSPGFSILTALVIGLGVGATTSVFSVLKPLLLAPLPFEEPDRLVWIQNASETGASSLSAVTSRSGNLIDFRERARSFEAITGYSAFFAGRAITLSGDGPPERLVGVSAADDFLDVLGVTPAHGRSFTAEEGLWDGSDAVILSHGFFVRRYGADPSIVGRAVTLDGTAHEVVGVLPASVDFSSLFSPGVTVDVLLTWPVGPETDAWGNTMFFIGRLRDGVSAEAAQADLDAIVAGLGEEQPDRWGLGADVSYLQAKIAEPVRGALLLLAAAASAVLLIVCVNVANMLLARLPSRAREVAVRKAFGASRRRLLHQLLTESVAVALAGGLLGTALAWGVTRFVAGTAGLGIAMLDQVRIDGLALAFASAVALLAGLAAGMIPALQVAEGEEAGVLRAGSRGQTSGRGARRLREGLVVAEVALACVLLVVGGLLLRSFQSVLGVDLGFATDEVLTWTVKPGVDFESNAARADFHLALAERVRALPGVDAAGLSDAIPLGQTRSWGFRVADVPPEEDPDFDLFPHIVDPGYRDAMRIPLISGRDLDRGDDGDGAPAVLMNESGARAVFPEGGALGHRLAMWNGLDYEIVGIVEDVRNVSLERDPGVQVYFPVTQMPDYGAMRLVVRSSRPHEDLTRAVSDALAELDPAMPTRDIEPLQAVVDRSLAPRRFTVRVLGAFGLSALLLAGLGIYGVLAQSVAERTPEIGIRMALGASAAEVLRSVIGRTLVLAAAGIAVGSVLALIGGRVLESLLFGIPPRDPVTFAAMAAALLGVAALAGSFPAVRAARVRGVRALQSD